MDQGNTCPPPPFTELSMERRLRKPEPPNTSSEINLTSQLRYVCQKVALKTLRIQKFGNLRAKAEGDGRECKERTKKSLYIKQQVHNHSCHQGLYKHSYCNVCIL